LSNITASDSTKLPLAGGTMTGTLTNSANVIVNGIVRAASFEGSGGALTGNLFLTNGNFYLQTGNFYLQTSSNGSGVVVNAQTSGWPVYSLRIDGTLKGLLGAARSTNDILTGTAAGDLVLRANNQKILFTADNGNTAHMAIDTAGRVGIGTTTATSKLTVAGTVELTAGSIKFPDGSTLTTAANRHLRFVVVDPAGVYAKDSEFSIWPQTDAAITVTHLEVTCDTDPTTEPAGNIKYADAFIGRANPIVINAFATTGGVLSTSAITNAGVAAGKCLYVSFDATPEAAMKQMSFDITYHYN